MINQKFPGRHKLAVLEKLVGEKFIFNYEPKFNDLPSKTKLGVVEALLADDFGSLLGLSARYLSPLVLSAIQDYGPKVLSWLYDKV
jgi:hypothetical protein